MAKREQEALRPIYVKIKLMLSRAFALRSENSRIAASSTFLQNMFIDHYVTALSPIFRISAYGHKMNLFLTMTSSANSQE